MSFSSPEILNMTTLGYWGMHASRVSITIVKFFFGFTIEPTITRVDAIVENKGQREHWLDTYRFVGIVKNIYFIFQWNSALKFSILFARERDREAYVGNGNLILRPVEIEL